MPEFNRMFSPYSFQHLLNDERCIVSRRTSLNLLCVLQSATAALEKNGWSNVFSTAFVSLTKMAAEPKFFSVPWFRVLTTCTSEQTFLD